MSCGQWSLVLLYYESNDDFKTLWRFFSGFNCSSHLFISGTREKNNHFMMIRVTDLF